MTDRYGSDVLSSDPHRTGAYAHRPTTRDEPAEPGLVVEEVQTGWVGAVIEDLDLRFGQESPALPVESEKNLRIYCVPVSSFRDGLAGDMLVNLLHRRGVEAGNAPARLVSGELVGWIKEADAEVICLVAVTPTTFFQVRYLCVKLRDQFPEIKMVVALREVVGATDDSAAILKECGADAVVTSLGDAASTIQALASVPRVEG